MAKPDVNAPIDVYATVREPSRDELALRHAPLVRRIAAHLASRLPPQVSVDDLVQCGMLALLDAARAYDAGRDASFETYAGIRIRGAMLDEVRANAWAPRSAHRRAREIAAAMRTLREQLRREPRAREVADALQLSLDDYHAALDAVSRGRLLSIEAISADDDGALPGADVEAGPQATLLRERRTRALATAIDALPERERLLVALYYQEELNFKEIGAVLGVGESRVCQLHGQAMLRLRSTLTDWRDEGAA